METATTRGPTVEAAQALSRYLRDHPDASGESVERLASKFDLSPEFVDQALRGAPRKPKPARPQIDLVRLSAQGALRAFDALTSKPLLFTAGLWIVFLVFMVMAIVKPAWAPSVLSSLNCLRFVFGTVATLQLATLYRHASGGIALRSALIFVLIGIVFFSILFSSEVPRTRGEPRLEPLRAFGAATILMFVLGAAFASLASFFSVLGSYVQIRREERRERDLSRQEMLERLLEVRARVIHCKEVPPPVRFVSEGFLRAFRAHPYVFSLAMHIPITVGALFAFSVGKVTPGSHLALTTGLAFVAVSIAALINYSVVGYLAGSFWRGFWLVFVSILATTPASFIPLGQVGPMVVISPIADFTLEVAIAAILCGFGALSWAVEDRGVRSRLMRESDSATLLAELVRLELKLNVHSQDVCVLVVDVAKSTEMKANADPFQVEFSFREYQAFVARICEKAGGKQLSTAGDGAIYSFASCESAFQAAREIQTEISFFNEHVNRMASKFRLRVGLHMGPISGDPRDVQYTEVIDIAAHIEEAAPVRGILLSQTVAACLPNEALIPLREPVDGFEVFLAYNPTVDA